MTAAAGGLEHVRHVFLEGCELPRAWEGRPHWRVLDTGFGAGLKFLSTWQAWRSDPLRPRLLHVVALVERPAAAGDLHAVVRTYPLLQPLADALASQWQGLVPGFHRLSFEQDRVLLTLCVGDPAAMLREQAFRADAVFLDAGVGAAPWTIDRLKAVTRLCRRGAMLAAPAASQSLRHDLQTCGWRVQVRPGLPAAGAGLAARHDPAWPVKALDLESGALIGDAVVIGAGLAGAAAAASLARRGWQVRVLDAAAAPAAGASSLPAGLLAPHQSPDDNLLSRLSRAGVRMTLEQARQRLAPGLEWAETGVLEWRGTDHRSLPALGEALLPWSREATDAQKLAAGVAAADTAWWHQKAAWIEPAALVRSWLREPGIRFVGPCAVAAIVRDGARWGIVAADGGRLADADLVVVAAGLGSNALMGDRLQLHAVGGQVTWAPHADDDRALPPFPVNGNGHFLPHVPLVDRGAWITGSSYRRGDADTSNRSEDTLANLERVRAVLPAAAGAMAAAIDRGAVRSWSGVRCASADRRPLVGEIAPGLWVSTAMGSRGLTFAALCGELLAARLHAEPLPLEARLAQTLDVARALA
ncbi:FAD-dependent 5-carboxymethylaminomethyl-2-thiouridine(34) oxidoreductase MnmC [Ramlibacter sp. PS3R-8]|uniref:FAD-dependent 5-carboxymethylaminomethyl-2-thiouridine(34) oxidoreductase MnmC n=1 Tax=Ramlibacter sp. PS3R-8 TaxID=3133437 RepID=UPI00309DF787